jgi:hypothetical protein
MTPENPQTKSKELAKELTELADKLNRYGYVLFHKTTQEEREWINNAFSEVAIRLTEISKIFDSPRGDMSLNSSNSSDDLARLEAVEKKIQIRVKQEQLLKMPMVDLDPTSLSYGHLAGLQEAHQILKAEIAKPDNRR